MQFDCWAFKICSSKTTQCFEIWYWTCMNVDYRWSCYKNMYRRSKKYFFFYLSSFMIFFSNSYKEVELLVLQNISLINKLKIWTLQQKSKLKLILLWCIVTLKLSILCLDIVVSNNLKEPDSPEYVAVFMWLEASPTGSPRLQWWIFPPSLFNKKNSNLF